MKNKIKVLIILVMISSFLGCNNISKNEILGVYVVDKQPIELVNNNMYYYLILDKNNKYYLKSNDDNKKKIVSSWKILNSKNDTLNIEFKYMNKIVIGKLKGNTFLFEKTNIFDQRLPASLYVKTNLEIGKIISSK